MYRKLLATLLHYANAEPPAVNRAGFYELKHRLLSRHARIRNYRLQHIVKPCYGPFLGFNSWGDPEYGKCGPSCNRCAGTGVYSERWVKLMEYEWHGRVFHIPTGDLFKRPETPQEYWIEGRIEHPRYGRASNEAAMWLYLLAGEWRMLWRALRGSCCCGRYAWPMLNLQRVVMHLSLWLSWRRCHCGRRFPTWGSGWCVCRRCRAAPVCDDDIPF